MGKQRKKSKIPEKKELEYIKFCFTYLETKIQDIPKDDFQEVIKKISELDQQTLLKIMSLGKASGYELLSVKDLTPLKKFNPKIASCSRIFNFDSWNSAKVAIFRYGAKKRLIGILKDKHFYLTYIDHKGNMYKH